MKLRERKWKKMGERGQKYAVGNVGKWARRGRRLRVSCSGAHGAPAAKSESVGAEKSVSDGLAALAGSELGKKNEITRELQVYIHEHTKHQLGLLLSSAERKISARRCCVRQESSR